MGKSLLRPAHSYRYLKRVDLPRLHRTRLTKKLLHRVLVDCFILLQHTGN